MPAIANLETESGITWATITYETFGTLGRISPRLSFVLNAKVQRPKTFAQILQGEVRLMVGTELLGVGALVEPGHQFSDNAIGVRFVIPVSHEAVRYIEEQFRGPYLGFTLEITTLLNIRDDNETPLSQGGYGGYEVKKWFITATKPTTLTISVPRSTWVTEALENLGYSKHVFMDMPIPPVPDQTRWQTVLDRLREADTYFLQGNDPGVFLSCRAAIEAMEGAPQHIFDTLSNENKRTELNELLKRTSRYFHLGRHVVENAGEYPVDHRDAEFALGLAKMFSAYIARLLVELPGES